MGISDVISRVQFVGQALGGDKEWMAIDTTGGLGRDNIYQVWSPEANVHTNRDFIFTRSSDGEMRPHFFASKMGSYLVGDG